MAPTLHRFVSHLISLVKEEMRVDKATTEKLLSGTLKSQQSKGIAILNLTIADVEYGIANSCNLILELKSETSDPVLLPQHKLTPGDFVAFKYHNSTDIKENPKKKPEHWVGIVVSINKWRIVLYFSNDDPDEKSIRKNPDVISKCRIVKLPNEISHERMLKALANLNFDLHLGRKNIPPLIKVLFGLKNPSKPKSMENIKIKDTSLNQYQREAVRFVLGSPEVALIHGPPGKTQTLVEVIRQLVEDKKRVLVCGPSNVSVDNLMVRYTKYDKNVVRNGHIARVSPDVVNWTIDVLCSGRNIKKLSAEIRKVIRESSKTIASGYRSEQQQKEILIKKLTSFIKKRIPKTEIRRQLRKANVVFSTLNGSGSPKLDDEIFDVIIIDEAAQAMEPDCWIAITKGKKVILAGDQWQLPPTVFTIPEKKNDTKAKGVPQVMRLKNDLTYTLFDRIRNMYGNTIRKRLSIQYRMHEKIMRFSAQQFYGNTLEADSSVAQHVLLGLPKVKNTAETRVPIIVFDTSDTSTFHEVKGTQINCGSTVNNYESKVVRVYIEKLLKDGIKQDQIAVITPYKAQVAKLTSEMIDKWPKIEVGTVDGFQGKEKEVIILSLVRSNKQGSVGFVAEKRRLNVAMTRARRQLVVVGDTVTLKNPRYNPDVTDPYYIDRAFLRDWINWLYKNAEVRKSSSLLRLF